VIWQFDGKATIQRKEPGKEDIQEVQRNLDHLRNKQTPRAGSELESEKVEIEPPESKPDRNERKKE
jgi:hypothetical protein